MISSQMPASWLDAPELIAVETMFYLVFGSVAATALVVVAAVGLLPFARLRGTKWYVRAVLTFTSLLGVAALVGIPANALFVAVLRYRYYIPGDPTVGWLPFVPSGSWVIDPAFGGRFINGGSAGLLTAVWLGLAVPVWLVAWHLNRRMLRILRQRGLAY
jgi:hypothetical protein